MEWAADVMLSRASLAASAACLPAGELAACLKAWLAVVIVASWIWAGGKLASVGGCKAKRAGGHDVPFSPATWFPSPENRRFAARLRAPGTDSLLVTAKRRRGVQGSGNGRRIGCACAAA